MRCLLGSTLLAGLLALSGCGEDAAVSPDGGPGDPGAGDRGPGDLGAGDLGPETDMGAGPEVGPRPDLGPDASQASDLGPDQGPDQGPGAAPRLGLNDVSILVPLGADGFGAWPGLADAGPRGALLPFDLFERLPPLLPQPPGRRAVYDLFRVVAVRFDGCFKGQLEDPCAAQVRLVAQPIGREGTALDAAVHLFYAFDEPELPRLVDTLRDLRRLAPEVSSAGPLAVHPALAAQGPDGPYGQALRAWMSAELGAERLVRVTFMTREPARADSWRFGAFDVAPAGLVGLPIAEIDAETQLVILNPPDPRRFSFMVEPLGDALGPVAALLDSERAGAAPPAERAAALGTLLRLENPRITAVDAAQCATCHIATFARTSAEARFGALDSADRYAQPDLDLTPNGTAHLNPRSLRAFGWFDRQPAISPRVIHESAEVVLDLERRFPAVAP